MIDGDTFAILTEEPPTEFVIGLASTGLTAISISDPDQFAALQPRRGLKIVWNFQTQQLDDRCTRLHTETRVACSGRLTKIAFATYWLFVKPFSGLVRKETLKLARRQAEQRP